MTQVHRLTSNGGRLARATAGTWPQMANGKPRSKSQANILSFLEHEGVTLRHNAFTLRDEISRNGQRASELTDSDVRELYLRAHALGFDPPREFFDDVLGNHARANRYHPVRDYLDVQKWDGVPRVDRWLVDFAGADDRPLTRAISAKVLIAAVRRVRHPGCQFDLCMVLEGKQGAGKSTLVRTLAGEAYFTDCVNVGADPKTMIEQTAGSWFVEMAELSGIRKGEVEPIKAMISRREDRARLAYGKRTLTVPRQFVLIGTVNDSAYLRDHTGNRRFIPVKVSNVDNVGLAAIRDQLWAEAAHREALGEAISLPPELYGEAAAEQARRLLSDPWEEKLQTALEGQRGHIEIDRLWDLLNVKADKRDPALGNRLRAIMERMGFEKTRRRNANGDRPYCFTNDDVGTWIAALHQTGTDGPLRPYLGTGPTS